MPCSSPAAIIAGQDCNAPVLEPHTHNTEDAAELLELRWRGLREQLLAQGAEVSILEAMDAVC
jgi:hypothetical protein